MATFTAAELRAHKPFAQHLPVIRTLSDDSEVIDCARCDGAIGYVISDGRIGTCDPAYEACTSTAIARTHAPKTEAPYCQRMVRDRRGGAYHACYARPAKLNPNGHYLCRKHYANPVKPNPAAYEMPK